MGLRGNRCFSPCLTQVGVLGNSSQFPEFTALTVAFVESELCPLGSLVET